MNINQLPDWNEIYKDTSVEDMPWYLEKLDPDIEDFINSNDIATGAWLDLGTGPATQAAELQKLGFSVTATDISEEAVALAKSKYPGIEFLVDNILDSKLNKQFDYILDRGCFHVFYGEEVSSYIRNIVNVLKPGGILFLKCFSDKQPETGAGPYRYSETDIRSLFGMDFNIAGINDTIFHGDNKKPMALFCVLVSKK